MVSDLGTRESGEGSPETRSPVESDETGPEAFDGAEQPTEGTEDPEKLPPLGPGDPEFEFMKAFLNSGLGATARMPETRQ